MVNKLIKELDDLNIICKEERIAAFLELIKIHLEKCDKCNLKDGVKNVEW